MSSALVFGSLCVLSCAGDDAVFLRVRLRTDYQPIREFLSLSVTVEDAQQELAARIDGRYVVPGQELHTFLGLAPNEARAVTITLLKHDQSELAFDDRGGRAQKRFGSHDGCDA